MSAPTLMMDQKHILAMPKNTWHLIQDPNQPVAIGYWALVERPHDCVPLVMYPMLAEQNLTIAFTSPSCPHVGIYKLSAYDTFKRCPANHFWPFCGGCQRFQWPPEDYAMHQRSRAHEKAMRRLQEWPAEENRKWTWLKVNPTE